MQSSVRAVEAYRRSRLIDNVTIDEDKVCPVYRLEEVSAFLRNSPLDIVREMLDYTLKRLEHRSPVVKQKTLRFIKYASTKAGPDWQREMQRQVQTVRQLFHYRGSPDPLKGDALNKAVRDTAHEAVAAIFGSEEKPQTLESLGKRIQGFGSSNYDMPRAEEKKSVISELVGMGSNSIRQAVESFSQYNHYHGSTSGTGKNLGSYRGGQNLRRSLTTDRERPALDEPSPWDVRERESVESRSESFTSDTAHSKTSSGNSGRAAQSDTRIGYTSEDRLFDSLTHPGGVRLQPTRETLARFTIASRKLDAVNLVSSLETKLKAHSWQVRFKALCLLEVAVRSRGDNEVLNSLVTMFEEDASKVVDSLQSPQTTLREKAKKVLELLGSGLNESASEEHPETAPGRSNGAAPATMPDLIDTSFDLLNDGEGPQNSSRGSDVDEPAKPAGTSGIKENLFEGTDWFNDTPGASNKLEAADPFAGMSLHNSVASVGDGGEGDLFSGLDVDSGSRGQNGVAGSEGFDSSNTLDELSVSSSKVPTESHRNVLDLFGTLSMEESNVKPVQDPLLGLNSKSSQVSLSKNGSAVPSSYPTQLSGMGMSGQNSSLPALHQQMMFMPGMVPMGMHGHFPQNVLLQQALASGNVNFAAVGGPLGQHQFPGGFVPIPMFGGMAPGNNFSGGMTGQSYPDGFDFSGDPTARISVPEATKEDTKAFDFISDHISSVMGPKKSR